MECTCGAPRPRRLFVIQTKPVGWWCDCGEKWVLLSEVDMRPAATEELFSGAWLLSNEYQERYMHAVANRLRADLRTDWWNPALIA
jgi:hypothetical protein